MIFQKSNSLILFSILLFGLLYINPLLAQSKSNHLEKNSFTNTFDKNDSNKVCKHFYTPFDEVNRDKYQSVKRRMISWYGEFRSSYKRGHKHAGVDLKGKFNELVYPIENGQVIKVFKSFPHKSIVIKHDLSDGNNIYSIFTHVEDIKVKIGDWVDENTVLARLFNQKELENSDFGTLNHLHL